MKIIARFRTALNIMTSIEDTGKESVFFVLVIQREFFEKLLEYGQAVALQC